MGNRNGTATQEKPKVHNRIAEKMEDVEVPEADQLSQLVREREPARRTKLHKKEKFSVQPLSRAVVRTRTGAPDMRFAENRNIYMPDPSLTVTGEPDQRFIENRQDIVALHDERGETRPNVIFAEDE
jgi:hypothetical protein